MFEQIISKAHEAGVTASQNVNPTPMTVCDPRTGQQWHIADGVCGFASIKFKGNTSFGRWMKKNGHAKSCYESGLRIGVPLSTQSLARNEAYARAYVEVLKQHGIEAWAESRID